jgi:ornithine--oxo-acid transaminase
MPLDLKGLVESRMGENYDLHYRHVNRTLVEVQRFIGFDRVYVRAEGAWLYDKEGNAYLDFLSGYSVYNLGRNHPAIKRAMGDVLEMDLPNMVQMDCSLLSGLLAEALVAKLPMHLDAVFFCNSGTESVESALKFARAATGRPGWVSLEGSFHGLSLGALSVMGDTHFREGFEPLLGSTSRVPLGNLEALRSRVSKGDVAAFIIEPVQGKGVRYPQDDYFLRAQQICREHGVLLISDEVQTGLGRTGRWWGFEHWGLEPDIVTIAKSLSGGCVPCAAVVARRSIYQKTFSRLDRCVVHSSTFGRNNLAMACGLATLNVLEEEGLVQRAREWGGILMEGLRELQKKHSLIRDVRGRGLMLAVEFQEPCELAAKLGWKMLHGLEPELFVQMLVTTLLSRHRVLTQVAGHGMDVLKVLPPLVSGEREVQCFLAALDAVLEACRTFPGPIWDLGVNLLRHSAWKARGTP